jgi:hypothetical protein
MFLGFLHESLHNLGSIFLLYLCLSCVSFYDLFILCSRFTPSIFAAF